MTLQAYLPFRGFSGWFSCSINPEVVQLWDHYGGTLAGEDEANYLFSDDASSKDTVRVYETQQDIAVFQSSWIYSVIQNRCTIHDVPLGQHLLLPHFLSTRENGSPHFTLRSCVTNHMVSSDNSDGNADSRESHCHSSYNKPACAAAAAGEKVVVQRPAVGNSSVDPLSESASVMFAEYNATWDELESRLNNIDLKDIADTYQVPCVVNATLTDFVVSQPQFKIRRV